MIYIVIEYSDIRKVYIDLGNCIREDVKIHWLQPSYSAASSSILHTTQAAPPC